MADGRTAIVYCTECDAMYAGETVTKTLESWAVDNTALLPCGHKASSVVFDGSTLRENAIAAELLEWIDRQGFLDMEFLETMTTIREELERRGGKYTSNCNLALPEKE